MRNYDGMRVETTHLNGKFINEFMSKKTNEHLIKVKMPYQAKFTTGNGTEVDLSNFTFILSSAEATRDVYLSEGIVYYIYTLQIRPDAYYSLIKRRLRDGKEKNIDATGTWLNDPSDFEIVHYNIKGEDILAAIDKANNEYFNYKRSRDEQTAEKISQ